MEKGHWLVVGGRKEAAVPWGLQRREGGGSLCGEDWSATPRSFLAPWGEGCRGPITKTTRHGGLSHQLTMGSTSASRSNSSWISSVLPESLLATELGDGEFLESTREDGTVRGQPENPRRDSRSGKGSAALPGL